MSEFTSQSIKDAMDRAMDKVMCEKLRIDQAVAVGRFRQYFLEDLGLFKPVVSATRSFWCPLCEARVEGRSPEDALCVACDYTIAAAQALFEGTRERRNKAPVKPAPVVPQPTGKGNKHVAPQPAAKAAPTASKASANVWTCIGCSTVQEFTKKARCRDCKLAQIHSVAP